MCSMRNLVIFRNEVYTYTTVKLRLRSLKATELQSKSALWSFEQSQVGIVPLNHMSCI